MKKFNYLTLALIIVLSSCSKDDDKNSILNRGNVNYSINGKSGTYTKANSRVATLLTFGNSKEDLISILMEFPKKSPASYDSKTKESITITRIIKKDGVEKTYSNNTQLGEPLKPNFKIVISKYKNKKTSGSFEFALYNAKDKNDVLNIKGTFTDVPDL